MHRFIHIYVFQFVNQMMGLFCDRLELGSTAALDFWTGQNKGRYHKKRALIPTRLVDPGQYLLCT